MINQEYDATSDEVIDSNNGGKYLSFMLGGETYAMSILQIREIIEYSEITSMPMMPDFIRGAINLRGHILPVLDLSIRLKNRETEITRRTCIVVVDIEVAGEIINVGFIVDAVSRVLDFNEIDIEQAPTLGEKIRTDFIAGMGKVNDDFVVILDVEKIMMMDDLQLLVLSEEQMPEDDEDASVTPSNIIQEVESTIPSNTDDEKPAG